MGKGKPRGNPSKITAYKWKRGQSGNPKGRPRKEPLTDILRQVLHRLLIPVLKISESWTYRVLIGTDGAIESITVDKNTPSLKLHRHAPVPHLDSPLGSRAQK